MNKITTTKLCTTISSFYDIVKFLNIYFLLFLTVFTIYLHTNASENFKVVNFTSVSENSKNLAYGHESVFDNAHILSDNFDRSKSID